LQRYFLNFSDCRGIRSGKLSIKRTIRKALEFNESETMKAKAVARLKFPLEKHSGIIYETLMPEIEKPSTVRSRANLKKDSKFLILKIEATDTVALRATLNAYLRWINSVLGVLEVLENASQSRMSTLCPAT
jgi:KEOPS complex subunit Pcc1